MWPAGEFDYDHNNVTNTYVVPYNHSMRMTDKVDTVMRWMTNAKRPANLVMLYFDEPDFLGHIHSPDSNEVGNYSRTRCCCSLRLNLVS